MVGVGVGGGGRLVVVGGGGRAVVDVGGGGGGDETVEEAGGCDAVCLASDAVDTSDDDNTGSGELVTTVLSVLDKPNRSERRGQVATW